MYYDILELLYNNKISLFSTKNLNDALTRYILEHLDNKTLVFTIYNLLVRHLTNNNIIIKGGISVQTLLNNNISGDLDVEIPIDPNVFDSFIRDYHVENVTPTFYDLKSVLNDYIDDISSAINDINLYNLVPINCILQNNIYGVRI